MTHHLGYDKHSKSDRQTGDANYRNGHSSKKVLTDDGDFVINSPRDRKGSFEPQIVPKRHNRFTGFTHKFLIFQ